MPTGSRTKRCQPVASAHGATLSLVPQKSSRPTPCGSFFPATFPALRRCSQRASTSRSRRRSGTTCSANSCDRATSGAAKAYSASSSFDMVIGPMLAGSRAGGLRPATYNANGVGAPRAAIRKVRSAQRLPPMEKPTRTYAAPRKSASIASQTDSSNASSSASLAGTGSSDRAPRPGSSTDTTSTAMSACSAQGAKTVAEPLAKGRQ
mmetsp:Transcript_14637/g.40390  ORF Transcript_14637/g.40390 Transcript_14637/m.40390 type:complete len:207 (+) Transcript_14637:127-747(+)